MRKISADYIFTINTDPIKKGVLTVDDEGTILEINQDSGSLDLDIEYHNGIICPGFINTHCHIELSYLRSQITEKTGITGFISELMAKRVKYSEEEIQKAIEAAETEMIKGGIVAVGDISNNNSSFKQKAKRNLLFHTFTEILSVDPDKAKETFIKGLELKKELEELRLPNSIVPHAPYTISLPLLNLINDYASENKSIISIHNQESREESELFISSTGPMFELFKRLGINTDLLRKTELNSLQSTLPHMNKAEKILLVHNTYTKKEDFQWLKSNSSGLRVDNLYWCTCPNANIFIENELPDYDLFINENAKITIGTDSLASNWSLSVLDELKTISKYNPHITLQTLLTWATKNGAEFFGLDHLGTIEKGKRPGLNLLKNLWNSKLTATTKVQKLI